MNMRLCILSTVALVFVMVGGCEPGGLTPGEGFVEVDGGHIWYRIVGGGTATPLVLLHGGPGAPSFYLNPLAALADERPVIFYDQLGCGRSEAITDTSLMTVQRFVRELRQLREALGLEKIHLYGHSWGTMLATDYMLTKPTGVQSLILASPAISIPMWVADAKKLLATMPESVQRTIARHEAAGTTSSPEYQEATMLYYQRFMARKLPWSADVDSTFANFNLDVYGYMWGPSEFNATGTLQNYDRTDRLGEITVPTLFTTGEYDEATPETVEYYHSLVPGSEYVIIEGSAHLTMHDQTEEYIRVVRDFLRRVESGK